MKLSTQSVINLNLLCPYNLQVQQVLTDKDERFKGPGLLDDKFYLVNLHNYSGS